MGRRGQSGISGMRSWDWIFVVWVRVEGGSEIQSKLMSEGCTSCLLLQCLECIADYGKRWRLRF